MGLRQPRLAKNREGQNYRALFLLDRATWCMVEQQVSGLRAARKTPLSLRSIQLSDIPASSYVNAETSVFNSLADLSEKLAATGYFIDPVMTEVVFLTASRNNSCSPADLWSASRRRRLDCIA